MKKLLAVIITLALIITAVPLTFAAAEESGEVLIVADGVTYKVKQGDTFNYVYYLNTGEKLCSLQAEFFYDAEGLELIIPENPFDLEESMILYRLALSAVTRMVEPGHMKYNYSNADGMDFNTDDSILIRAQFKVTAAEGTYEIRNVLNTIAGADEHKYLYDGEVVDPLKKAEGGIPALTPYDPTAEPTEAPTQAPTEAPTQAPTEAPTQAPTEAPTQAPTEAPTQAPTDAPTQAPTDAPTQAPTEAPTQAPTEAPTQAPTEAPTQAPTEAPTQAPTQAPTEAPTQAPTEAPTEPAEKSLVHEATGIKVVTDLDAELVVSELKASDPNYYLHDADTLKFYDIVIMQEGRPVTLTEPVKLMIPAADQGGIYRYDTGVFTDMQAAYANGYVTVTTDTLGRCVLATEGEPKASMYGDVDGDGDLTIVDGSYIQRDLAGIKRFDDVQRAIGDVDGSGDVEIIDSTHIQRWLAGLLDNNPLVKFGYPRTTR